MHSNILYQSNLTLDQFKKLNQINLRNKSKIERLLKTFYKKVNSNQEWILSPLMSSDKVQCRLYSDLNFLELINFYVKKKNIKKVVVNNYFLGDVIKQKYKHLDIEISGGTIKIISDLTIIIKSFFKVVLCSIFMIMAKKKSRNKYFYNKKITLIETFFFNNLFKNNNFQERYHLDVYKKFPKKIKKNCYFFPINLSIFSIKRFLKITNKSNLKFIHPLDFLKLEDYTKSIFFNFHLNKLPKSSIKYENFEIKKILNYYNFLSNFNFSSFLGKLNFYFLQRLKENNLKVELIIDWYENQLIDKGLSLGKNTFYPNAKLKGHVGFLNDFKNIHYYTPTKLESDVNVIPDELLLISKEIKNTVFGKLGFIKKKIVPAIRNKNIFNINSKTKINKNKNSRKNILIVLSSNIEESRFIKRVLKDLFNSPEIKKYNIILKPHVNTPDKLFKDEKKLQISNKSFYKLLLDAEIVVSGGTTATIEAAIMNKKIILIGNTKDITLNPLLIQSENSEEVFYSSNQFSKSLKKLSLKKNKNTKNLKLLNLYFTRYKKKYFENFYN